METNISSLSNSSAEPKQKGGGQCSLLMAIAGDFKLFRSPEGEAFADVFSPNGRTTLKIRSASFKSALTHRFFRQQGKSPSAQALQDAVNSIEAKALFDGETRPVFLRTAHHNGDIFVDLGTNDGAAVQIDQTGWRVIADPPVRFYRSKTMQALPAPLAATTGVTIESLRRFLNVSEESDFKLAVAWIISALNPMGPYPILTLYGEQGAAKTTTTRVLRALVDPSSSPLRALPKRTEDLMIAAKNNRIIAIDNVSYISEELSDDFCRLSTGGGLSKRQLYTDDEETVLDAKRSLILNGIDEFVSRGDLASRSIFIHLPSISPSARVREEVFWAEFENVRPQLFGLILSALNEALCTKDAFRIPEAPRMADAWHFISAAETYFGWPRYSCLEAFQTSQRRASEAVLETSPLYPFIREVASINWSGTPEALLQELNQRRADLDMPDVRAWPQNPRSLTDKLRRLLPALKDHEIEIQFSRTAGSNSQRWVELRKLTPKIVASVAEANSDSSATNASNATKEIQTFL